MTWSIYSRVGSIESLDLDKVVELLDLPEDYPSEELYFYGPMIIDKNGECVAMVVLGA